MKKQFLICLMFVLPVSVFAQQKEMLTKEETINYLNKKLKECEGHYRTPSARFFTNGKARKMYYSDLSFSEDEAKVVLRVKSSNYNERKYAKDYFEKFQVLRFDPAQIVSIGDSVIDKNEPLGMVILKLRSNSALYSQNVYWYKNYDNSGYGVDFGNHDGTQTESINVVLFVYLRSDPANFNKIKKAFEHLRNLCKAEDDPFGE